MSPYGHMNTGQSILPQNPRFKVAFEVTCPTPSFEAEILVPPLWPPPAVGASVPRMADPVC